MSFLSSNIQLFKPGQVVKVIDNNPGSSHGSHGFPISTVGAVVSVKCKIPFKYPYSYLIKDLNNTSYWVIQEDLVASSYGQLGSSLNNPITSQSTHTAQQNTAWKQRKRNAQGQFISDNPEEKKPVKEVKKLSLDNVIISDEKKSEIKAAISQLEHHDLIFNKWGFSEVFEKGTAVTLLFWGIPGTGKTLTAQAIADELGAELKIYSTAEIESFEPGGAERTIQAIFGEAKRLFTSEKKQRVLLFDECDSLLLDRNEVGPIIGAQINVLLSEIERHEGIIIFTTNRLGKLDPALERRVSAKIEFEFPNKDQRALIWQRLIPANAPLGANVDFKELAKHPLAGGNIKNVVLNAARMAAYNKSLEITLEYFNKAIEREMEAIRAFIEAYEQADGAPRANVVSRQSTGLSIDKVKKSVVEHKESTGGWFSNNK